VAGKRTTQAARAFPANRATGSNHWVAVPIARINGVAVDGAVLARIVNQSGTDSKPLVVQSNPVPYLPATLDTTRAMLTTHTRETVDGAITEGPRIAPGDWAFARCDAASPFPGTPIDNNPANAPGNLPVHICLRNGFDPKLLYQVVYPARNAYILGVGMAAFRDVGSFFRYEAADDVGTPILSPAGRRERRYAASRSQATWCASSSSWA
jgi:hypothetical protein